MKRKKIISAFGTIVLSISLFINPPQADSTICVGGGALAITAVPTDQSYGTRTVSASQETLLYTYTEAVQFEDLTGSDSGFNVMVTATDFVDPISGNFIDVTNLKIASDDNDTLGFIDCDDTTGITVVETELSSFTDVDDDGTSDSKILFIGDTTTRIGKYLFEPEIELIIPPYTPTGTYETTLTFSIY